MIDGVGRLKRLDDFTRSDLESVALMLRGESVIDWHRLHVATADEAREILREAPGCLVIDKREPGGYITPFEAAGEDATYISRIREDATVENGLVLWCVSDNLRKGAALNAIQIAECLINRKLISAKKKAA